MLTTTLVSVGAGGRSLADAQHNRDYVVSKVSSEIHEIIRVLQLTTYDEEEWDADDITVMKKAQVGLAFTSLNSDPVKGSGQVPQYSKI